MTLSVSSPERSIRRNDARGWLLLSLFCALFSLIYEQFSHGVYADAMIFLFAVPLMLGAVPCMILFRLRLPMPGRLYQDGVLAMTLTVLLSGILTIYGTTSDLTGWFLLLACVLLAAGSFVYVLRLLRMHRT